MNLKPIPILDLKAQYSTIKEEIQAAIERVLDSQQFILGTEVEALEKELAEYCQCKFAFGVSSGTDALILSLMAIDIKPGDEVITTPYSFFATSGSIVRLGAIPVYVDIDPATFNIQGEQIEPKITAHTKAILPVHLAGQVADMGPIMEIANQHGLSVIEDACQAIGSDYKGKRAGSIGHLGCFSFFPSKNLGGYGDSGMVTCNDAILADKVSLLRNHGQRPKYHNHIVGGNFRMDAIQAAVLESNSIIWRIGRRPGVSTHIHIGNYLLMNGISVPLRKLVLSTGSAPSRSRIWSPHLSPIHDPNKIPGRAFSLSKNPRNRNEIYYPIPLHLQECFSDMGFKPGDFPQSERAAKETLALPIYPELSEDMLSRIVDTIVEFHKSHNNM